MRTVLTLSAILAVSAVASADPTYFVTQFNNNRVLKVSEGVVSVFASTGLNNPFFMAADGQGNIFVSNWGDSTIAKISSSGVVSHFANVASPASGLSFGKNGLLYASLSAANKVVSIDSSGTSTDFANTLYPVGVTTDTGGNVFAVNYFAKTVSKFDSSGVGGIFATGFGSTSYGPTGITFGMGGDLFVTQNETRSIYRVKSDGTSSLYKDNLAYYPMGISYDGKSDLYVANDLIGEAVQKVNDSGVTTVLTGYGRMNDVLVVSPVPEPASMFALGLGALALVRRRKGGAK